MVNIMTKYFTKEQVMTAMGEQNLMLDDIWGVEQRLDELPAADVVEVVRCKDCKYKNMESGEFDGLEPACRFWTDADAIYPVFVDMNGYCSEGKRKDGGRKD